MARDLTYLVVEAKPKNKSEYDQLGIRVIRAENIRVSLDGTKFIIPWDGTKKPRPGFLDNAKTKTYTHDQMIKEINKKKSEWQDNG